MQHSNTASRKTVGGFCITSLSSCDTNILRSWLDGNCRDSQTPHSAHWQFDYLEGQSGLRGKRTNPLYSLDCILFKVYCSKTTITRQDTSTSCQLSAASDPVLLNRTLSWALWREDGYLDFALLTGQLLPNFGHLGVCGRS